MFMSFLGPLLMGASVALLTSSLGCDEAGLGLMSGRDRCPLV